MFMFITGLAFALGVGHLLVGPFLTWVRANSDVDPKRPGREGVPPCITGLVERTLAFAVAFANVEGAYVVLIAWMTAKLALNWNRPGADVKEDERQVRVYGISALLAGTLSLGIGVIGGLIARCGTHGANASCADATAAAHFLLSFLLFGVVA
jgi:hypothetical protein